MNADECGFRAFRLTGRECVEFPILFLQTINLLALDEITDRVGRSGDGVLMNVKML
jgi:hypothetical protein